MLAGFGPDGLERARGAPIPQPPVAVPGTLHWDILVAVDRMLDGLRAAAAPASCDGVGVDSWAVDYGLLDAAGALLGNPVHYRDTRTDGEAAEVARGMPAG